MKIHVLALGLGILLLAAPAFAATVDGKWTGSIDTPNGPGVVAPDQIKLTADFAGMPFELVVKKAG